MGKYQYCWSCQGKKNVWYSREVQDLLCSGDYRSFPVDSGPCRHGGRQQSSVLVKIYD